MDSITIILDGKLPDLNQAIKLAYSFRGGFAKLKKETEYIIKYQILTQKIDKKFNGKVHISYKWYEQNKRRDKDNIAFAKKFINDALVDLGIINGDGWRDIESFSDTFYVDKDHPRVEIKIIRIGDENETFF